MVFNLKVHHSIDHLQQSPLSKKRAPFHPLPGRRKRIYWLPGYGEPGMASSRKARTKPATN
jgi:hypothetical protein